MAKIAELIVIEYLNRQGYTTVQSIKKRNREWDVLAVSYQSEPPIAKHYEVQVSFDPVSYLSNKNAKKRSCEEVSKDINAWVEKKFKHKHIQMIRQQFFSMEWEYVVIHVELKDPRELDCLEEMDIKTLSFSEILKQLCAKHPRDLPFTAEGKDIVELIRYAVSLEI